MMRSGFTERKMMDPNEMVRNYYIKIDCCDDCTSCGPTSVDGSIIDICYLDNQRRGCPPSDVPDWCPRNAKPAEYIQLLEKQQSEKQDFDKMKLLYLDALEEIDRLKDLED